MLFIYQSDTGNFLMLSNPFANPLTSLAQGASLNTLAALQQQSPGLGSGSRQKDRKEIMHQIL